MNDIADLDIYKHPSSLYVQKELYVPSPRGKWASKVIIVMMLAILCQAATSLGKTVQAKRVKLTALKSEKWTQIMTYFNNSKPVNRQGHGDEDLRFNLVWSTYFKGSPEDREWSEI